MSKRNDGSEYEEAVEAFVRTNFPGCQVIRNHKIKGLFGRSEQIDVFVSVPMPLGPPMSIGVEAKNYKRRLDKDRFASIFLKFWSAKVNRGIILTASKLQAGVEQRIQSLPFDFQVEIMSLEELVESAWAKDFLQALPKLELAKIETSPSALTIGMVTRAIELHDHYAKHFLHDIKNLTWIPILEDAGVWQRAARGENKLSPMMVADYLALGVEAYPAVFLDYCKAVKPNWWILRTLVTASEKLNPDERMAFFEIATSWAWHSSNTDEITKLVAHELECGRTERAIGFLGQVFQLEAKNREISEGFSKVEIESNADRHDFRELFVERLPNLVELAPEAVLSFCRDLLSSAESSMREGATYNRLWFIHHVRNQVDFLTESILGSLVESYVLCLVKADQKAECHIFGTLNQEFGELACRCVLYACSQWHGRSQALRAFVYGKDDLWRDDNLDPELESFVGETWSEVDEGVRIGRLEEFLAEAETLLKDTDGDKARWPLQRLAGWFAFLISLGIPEGIDSRVMDCFKRLSQQTGIDEPADRTSRSGIVMSSNPVPEETQSFPSWPVNKVLGFCRRFQPTGDFLNQKTPDGVARELERDILSRPVAYLRSKAIRDLPFPTYRRSAISALAKACCSNRKVRVRKVCELGLFFLSEPVTADGHTVVGAGLRRDIFCAIADAIEDIADRYEGFLELDALGALLDGLKGLVDDPEERRGFISGGASDISLEILNSSDGKVALAIAAVAGRCLRQLRISDVPYPLAEGEGMYHRARQLLQSEVVEATEPRMRGVIGRNFFEYWRFDRPWVIKNLDKIFPQQEPVLWNAVWESYLHSIRDQDVLKAMRHQYQHALEVCRDAESIPGWAQSLGHDLAFWWLVGDLKDSDPLILSLLKAKHEIIRAASWQVGHYLHERKNEAELDSWLEAARIWNLLGSVDPSSRDTALTWLDSAPPALRIKDFSDLIRSAVGGEFRHFHLVYEFIAKRAANEPGEAASITNELSRQEIGILSSEDVENIKTTLLLAHERGDDQARTDARQALENLLRQNLFGFNDLIARLDALNAFTLDGPQ